MRSTFQFSFLASSALGGCYSETVEAARDRGAFDLRCDRERIGARERGGGAVEVYGCGRRAVYVCALSGGLAERGVCVREVAP